MTKFSSHVALDDTNRERLIAVLNTLLAATMDLYSQVKHAHWNVKGELFYSWHELFDDLAEPLLKHADVLAERTATLGGEARGTLRQAAEGSPLPEYDAKAVDGREHLRTLVDRYAQYNAAVRESMHAVQDLDDLVTQDRLIDVLHDTEMGMWFLESHLQGYAGGEARPGRARAPSTAPQGRGSSSEPPRG